MMRTGVGWPAPCDRRRIFADSKNGRMRDMKRTVAMVLLALTVLLVAAVAHAERDTLPGGGVGVTRVDVRPW